MTEDGHGIRQDIMDRLGLGAEEGYDMTLIGVSGTGHAGERTARESVHRRYQVPRENIIMPAEYAGRASSGDPVYLVTWKLGES